MTESVEQAELDATPKPDRPARMFKNRGQVEKGLKALEDPARERDQRATIILRLRNDAYLSHAAATAAADVEVDASKDMKRIAASTLRWVLGEDSELPFVGDPLSELPF